ncbi:MAG: hypothetical protein UX26_C0007G0014 [Parcubacteria group bacterium GW2011_GWC1_45_9]|nr:MAG: hypothetical protein UW85_C0001G0026 [Parcubacteria group bacterium GW2011_GWA1_Parcubacteria_45_10]KKT89311.1 MAG: hypothetical protein UW89_C0001G0039 [Parcubacteria group bacterium GW2011_GWB1_45_10]KKU17126.1 MAG: hypothetical protein UX26_C0007G0014 [Parcubacteria group bacterium GW2011_GWC1_45_9]
MNSEEDRILIGEAEFRNKRTAFGIKIDDLRRHVYVIGMTGSGKTTLLDTMAIYHIQNNRGVGVIDPHGEFSERLLDFVPKERIDDVVYINPSDTEFPIAFNVMENVAFDFRHNVASGLLSVFKKIWPDVWSARMEYILNNTLLALLEYPDSTLLAINRMLSDKDYRKMIVSGLQDPVVKAFWTNEFARYHDRFQVEAIAPIQNKVGQFTSNPLIRNIIGQKKTKINLREIIDSNKILIIRLPVGLVGETNAQLLGGLLVTKIQQAAMSRIDIPESKRRDFCLIIDEFQNFATESFVKILAEARKYRLSLIMGHQYIEQVPEEITAAIFGNVGTHINFRVGAKDAEIIEPQFLPNIGVQDLVNLPNHYFYTKMMIDGITSSPFLASTLPPQNLPPVSYAKEIINLCQLKYGTNKKIVQAEIAEWLQPANPENIEEDKFEPQESNFASMSGVLFEATCSSCGREVRVPFQPDPKRSIYCKKCLKNLKKGKEEKKDKKQSLSEMLKNIITGKKTEKKPEPETNQEPDAQEKTE